MSARQGHHGPKIWAHGRGSDVRWAVMTLARALGAGSRRPYWRGPSWQNSPRWRPSQRREPWRFSSAPPRGPFQGSREPGYWRPRSFMEERWGSKWQRSPMQRPSDWRRHPMPRRGPPVATIMVPRWYRPVVWDERRPRGSNPRGPLRGGPERSADDPQRAPRDSRRGEPERSADDPRLSKTTQHHVEREAQKERKGTNRPTVITVDKDEQEACCGPLSRQAAWRAGHFWEDMRGDVHVSLEKDGQRKEV